MDVERLLGRHHRVGFRECVREGVDVEERSVGRGVHVREVEHRLHEVDARGDRADVVDRAEVAHATHHLDAERHQPILLLEPRAQLSELLDHGVDRVLARAIEQEAGVEHDHLGAGRFRDPRRMVEHPEGHVQLLPSLGVTHEAGDRRMQRDRDAVRGCEPAELGRSVVVGPELPRRRHLARRQPPLQQRVDHVLRRIHRAVDRRAVVQLFAHWNG